MQLAGSMIKIWPYWRFKCECTARHCKVGIFIRNIRVTSTISQITGKVHWETLRLQVVAELESCK